MPENEKKASPEAVPANSTNGGEELASRVPVDIRSLALSIIATLSLILMLQYAESVLIPVTLGVLISYALAPMVNSLARAHIPRAVGAAVAVAVLVGGLGLGVYTLSDEAMSIVGNVPVAARRLRERVIARQRHTPDMLTQVQQAANEIEKTATLATKLDEEQKRGEIQRVQVVAPPFKATDYLWMGGVGLLGFLGQFVMILFLVYFLLVTGDLYKRKLVRIAGPTLSKKKVTVQILDEINQQIENFIKVQLLTCTIVAIATGAALWWFGVQNFAMWGLVAGLFNSIPYAGPVIVTVGLGVISFMQFDDLLKTTYVCAVTFAITSIEGFLMTPALMGRAAQMNPVAVFVGLLFWTWVWGIWGTILAVPMLMMFKAICDHVEDLQPIGELLGE
jgi:predicted PurR-regulated permease PerM